MGIFDALGISAPVRGHRAASYRALCASATCPLSFFHAAFDAGTRLRSSLDDLHHASQRMNERRGSATDRHDYGDRQFAASLALFAAQLRSLYGALAIPLVTFTHPFGHHWKSVGTNL